MSAPATAAATRDLRESMTIAVDATPTRAHEALRRVDLTAPVIRALHALDGVDRFALLPQRIGRTAPLRLGMIWRIDAGRPAERVGAERFESFGSPGYIKVRWTVAVEASDGDSRLSIGTRFTATDDRSAARLRDGWSLIGPLSHALVQRAAHAVKTYAEELCAE